jgi:hypothetical protein
MAQKTRTQQYRGRVRLGGGVLHAYDGLEEALQAEHTAQEFVSVCVNEQASERERARHQL